METYEKGTVQSQQEELDKKKMRVWDPTLFGTYSGKRQERIEAYCKARNEGYTAEDMRFQWGDKLDYNKLGQYEQQYQLRLKYNGTK